MSHTESSTENHDVSPWNQFITYHHASSVTRMRQGRPWRTDTPIERGASSLNHLIELATQAENECSEDGGPSVSCALRCVAAPKTRPDTKSGVDVLGVYLAFNGREVRVTGVRAQSERMPADVWDAAQYLSSIVLLGFHSLPIGLQRGDHIEGSHQWLAWWS